MIGGVKMIGSTQHISEEITAHIKTYPSEAAAVFWELRQLIYDSVPTPPTEKLWAKLPSYYEGDAFIRLIPFKDHVNVEAQAISQHHNELTAYKLTPKGMLQIHVGQPVPKDILKRIFAETLNR